MSLRQLGRRLGANRVVVALSVARFGDALGNGILIILIPLYVASLPRPSWFPFSEEVRVGVLLALYGLTTSLLQPVAGAWTDRVQHPKLLIQIGLGVMGLATLGFVPANSYGLLAALRALQGVGVAITVPASLALLTTASEKHTRGGSMGIFTALRMAGLAAGPLAGSLLYRYVSFNAAFLVGGGFIALGFALVHLFVNPPRPEPAASKRPRFTLFDRSQRDPAILGVAFATFSMATAVAMMATLEQQFNARLAETAIGFSIAFSTLMVSRLITQVPLGALSDRIGRKPLLIAGMLTLAPATALLGLVAAEWELIALRLLQGVASAAVAAPGFALAGDLARRGTEGRQLSVVTTGFTFGLAFGPLLAGVLAAAISFETPFLFGAGLALVSVWVVVRYVPETAKNSAPR